MTTHLHKAPLTVILFVICEAFMHIHHSGTSIINRSHRRQLPR